MQYGSVTQGTFLVRRNRFIAEVVINDQVEVCHVKNTGRLRELLLPGARVVLALAADSKRKTHYDLIAVYSGSTLINIDSQAPNRVAAAYLPTLFQDLTLIRPECRFGASRLDFYLETVDLKRVFIEVKGVTLKMDEGARFPDAPTERGLRHVEELIRARALGYEAGILFVVQRPDVQFVGPNDLMQPAFGAALRLAAQSGVRLYGVDCLVTEDSLSPRQSLPVRL